MPLGTCGLCHKVQDLQKSHFVPAAFFKRLAKRDNEARTIVVAEQRAVRTSDQATAHFLCAACELRFHERGELWVIENSWQDDANFPLQAALLASRPVAVHPGGFRVYEAGGLAGVDVGQLVYFGLSLFWRGAARRWRIGRHQSTQLDLGPYEEALRRFLVGETGVPSGVGVVVRMHNSLKPEKNVFVTGPYYRGRDEHGRMYRCAVPGIIIELTLGKGLTREYREALTNGPHSVVYMSEGGMDEDFIQRMARVIGTAQRKGKLAR